MGLSTKKTKTTTNQNTTANVTPTNPEWVTNGISGLAGKIGDTFNNLDPQSLVAGADPLQAQAGRGAANLGNFGGGGGGFGPSAASDAAFRSANPGLMASNAASAAGMTQQPAGGYPPVAGAAGVDTFGGGAGGSPSAPDYSGGQGGGVTDPYGNSMGTLDRLSNTGASTVKAGDIQGGIAGFMNPYLNDVVNTSLADYDHGAGQQMGQANLDLANDPTYGGSGGALYKAGLGGEIARGRGTLASGLRSGAYDRAAALSAQQAGLNQQASGSNASLMEQALGRQGSSALGLSSVASDKQANDRANVTTQASIGDMLRQIADAKAKAPVTALGAQADLYGKLPLDLFKGQNATGSLSGTNTTKQSGAGLTDWLNFFAQNAQAAASAGGA